MTKYNHWNGSRFVIKHTRNQASQQLARQRMLKRYGSKCQHCGQEGYVELHHLVRPQNGGTFDYWNLILLCKPHHYQADKIAQIGP